MVERMHVIHHHAPGDLPPARRRRRAATQIGLNLTSMIDVVFLLLVYFMVATDFKKAEEVYRLDLPERVEGVSADPFELDDEPLRIIVRSSGSSEDIWSGPGMERSRVKCFSITLAPMATAASEASTP